jgi:hypothetical protein
LTAARGTFDGWLRQLFLAMSRKVRARNWTGWNSREVICSAELHYQWLSGRHMPTPIEHDFELQPGDYFEDCAYHPCLCVASGDGTVDGISLVDGSFPRNCGVPQCGVRKLTVAEAITWRLFGPQEVPPEFEETFSNPWWIKDEKMAEIVWPRPKNG